MQKFIVPMILAAFVLAGCGAKSGGTPITPSDSDPEATSVPSGSSTEATSSVDTSDFYVIPTLHLVFYEKFVNEDAAKGFIGGFNEYLTTKEVTVTTITYDLIGLNSDAGPFTDEVQAFEEAENHPYVFDAILGAKGNLTTYITDRFEVLKNDGSNVEFALGTKPDRRLYTRKDTENEAVPYLINHVRILAGLPEEEETSEDTSSEETSEEISEEISGETSGEASEEISGETSGEISEEISEEVSGETSEESSEEESKVLDLHVVYYEQYADASVQSAFQTAFEGYLTANGFTKGALTYKSLNSADVATFTSDLEAFQGTVEYQVDVLLGVKAKLGAYITTNYSVYQVDGANFEYSLGNSNDRRLWVRNGTVNTVGVEALVAYFTSIK